MSESPNEKPRILQWLSAIDEILPSVTAEQAVLLLSIRSALQSFVTPAPDPEPIYVNVVDLKMLRLERRVLERCALGAEISGHKPMFMTPILAACPVCSREFYRNTPAASWHRTTCELIRALNHVRAVLGAQPWPAVWVEPSEGMRSGGR